MPIVDGLTSTKMIRAFEQQQRQGFARLETLLRGLVEDAVRDEARYVPGEWEGGGWFAARRASDEDDGEGTPRAEKVGTAAEVGELGLPGFGTEMEGLELPGTGTEMEGAQPAATGTTEGEGAQPATTELAEGEGAQPEATEMTYMEGAQPTATGTTVMVGARRASTG
jgi:hypothetical protein